MAVIVTLCSWMAPEDPADHGLVVTVSMVTVPILPLLCEVMARPRSRAPVRLAMVMVDPGTVVHVTPSGEVAAVKDVPVRTTRR